MINEQNTKSIQQLSLLEIVDQPIGAVLDYLQTLSLPEREATGHAIALACYLQLSK